MFMLISNEPIKVAHLQNGALVIEMVNNSFSEARKTLPFDKARNVLIKKIYCLLDFAFDI